MRGRSTPGYSYAPQARPNNQLRMTNSARAAGLTSPIPSAVEKKRLNERSSTSRPTAPLSKPQQSMTSRAESRIHSQPPVPRLESSYAKLQKTLKLLATQQKRSVSTIALTDKRSDKNNRDGNKHEYVSSETLLRAQKISTFFGGITILIMMLAISYLIYNYGGPRERDILDKAIDLSKNPHHGTIRDSSEFEHVSKKPKGELSGEIVKDKKTGFLYLKKGAASKDALIKEFVASAWLALLRPGAQPEALIMQQRHDDGTAQFYTLSRIFNNSMDLEDFVIRGDWREKLAKKPLIGFDLAIAADKLLAKGQDTKLANYIVIETPTAHVVAAIDHEKWEAGLAFSSEFINHLTLNDLCRHIVDTNMLGQELKVGLYEQPEEVKAFLAHALKTMSMQNVNEFYYKIAQTNLDSVIRSIEDIHRHHGSDGIISDAEEDRYISKLTDIKKRAQILMISKEHENEIETERAISATSRHM